MKKIFLILIATVLTVAVYGQAERHYSFGWAYDYKTKTCYVSNIVSSQIDIHDGHSMNINRNKITVQWQDKLKTITSKWYNYTKNEYHWNTSRSKVNTERNKVIGKWKSEGYSIIEIIDFSYSAD